MLKRLHLFALLLMATVAAAAQVAPRVDVPLLTYGPEVPSSGGPLPRALFVSNATVQVCQHPATLTSCTPITTYTDATLTTACPSNAQLTQLPSTTCTASAGVAGNVGFWYQGGTVDYIVTAPYGTFGPYTVSTYTTGPYVPITGGTMTGPLSGTAANFSGQVKLNQTVILNGGALPWYMTTANGTGGQLADRSVNIVGEQRLKIGVWGCNPSTLLTAYSASGGTLTLTSDNQYSVGASIKIDALSGDPLFPINGSSFTVLSAGLSPTQFEISTGAITGSGTTASVSIPNATQKCYASDLPTDTSNEFSIYSDGTMHWGTGTAPQDLSLFRTQNPNVAAGLAPQILQTDGNFELNSQIIFAGASPSLVAPGSSGAISLSTPSATTQLTVGYNSGTAVPYYISLGSSSSGYGTIQANQSGSPFVEPLYLQPGGQDVGVNVPSSQSILAPLQVRMGTNVNLRFQPDSGSAVALANYNDAGSALAGNINIYDLNAPNGITVGTLASINSSGQGSLSAGLLLSGAAPTASSGQIGYGGGTATVSSCGSLASSAGCVIVNVAGTNHYIPYY